MPPRSSLAIATENEIMRLGVHCFSMAVVAAEVATDVRKWIPAAVLSFCLCAPLIQAEPFTNSATIVQQRVRINTVSQKVAVHVGADTAGEAIN